MNGVELIAAERERQIVKIGYEPLHDDSHSDGVLARAAAAYANPMYLLPDGETTRSRYPLGWPGNWEYKPTSRIRALVKAGALIAAEIDRLQRIEEDTPNG